MRGKSKMIPYTRKSSGEDPRISRDRQRSSIEAWARDHDVELEPEQHEPGVSGSKPWQDRALGKAIEACRAGGADGIIVAEQDRLTRENLRATGEVWSALDEAGIRLVCVAEGIDTANGDHELSFAVRAALSREQWKQYARRMDHVKRDAVVERGVHVAGRVPVGYRRPGRGQPLELDGRTADAIRKAFELRAAGATLGAIARELDRTCPGGPSGKGVWAKDSLHRVLSNRVYLGEARGGKYVKAGAHPAIVDAETFETVQAINGRREPRKSPQETVTLLPGLVRCASCGYAMVKTSLTDTRKGRVSHVYRCRGKSAAGKCPSRTTIMQPALDAHVEAAFLARLEVELDQELEPVEQRDEVEAAHRRIATLRARRETWSSPEVLERLGLEAWQRGIDEVDAELDELAGQLDELTPSGGGELDRQAIVESWPELTLDERRELLVRGVDAVIVSRSPVRGSNRVALDDRVEIRFAGDGPAFARPSRHGPEVVAGVPAA